MGIAELNKLLLVLNIERDIATVTLKDINIAFRKLVKVTHPDKLGDEKTEAMQSLLEAYDKLKYHFKSGELSDVDTIYDEEKFFRDNLEMFNFPFANKGSFTVSIEDHLANSWQQCMTKIMDEPKLVINPQGTECERFWKVIYGKEEAIELTIHLYNNPRNKRGSKLMIQGRCQALICSFVFEELPKIYNNVCQAKPAISVEKPKNKRSSKPSGKCDNCNFKSSLIQMKMHMKTVHVPKPTRTSKRLPDFTPQNILKTKKIKHNTSIEQNSTLALEVTFTGDDRSQKTNSSSVTIDCDICNLASSSTDELKSHHQTIHTQVNNEHIVMVEDISLMTIADEGSKEVTLDESVCVINAGGGDIENKIDNENKAQETQEAFHCTKCEKYFASELRLDNHLSIVYDDILKTRTTTYTRNNIPETIVICGVCATVFQTIIQLEQHMLVHSNLCKFDCNICDTSFSTEGELKKHIESKHSFSCEHCSNIFTTQ